MINNNNLQELNNVVDQLFIIAKAKRHDGQIPHIRDLTEIIQIKLKKIIDEQRPWWKFWR